jgi:hypothetical protein
MKSFPKKYKPKDLRNRSDSYKISANNGEEKENSIFSPNILSNSKKLSYQNFFQIYLKDFLNHKFLIEDKNNKEGKSSYEQLFIIF